MQEIDPFGPIALNNIGTVRNLQGRLAETREIFQKSATLAPAMLLPKVVIGLTYIEEGRPELALPDYRKLREHYPAAAVFEAMAHARAGRREEALRLIRPFEDRYPEPGAAMQWFAQVYAYLGDEPNTVKWLERSADHREFQALNLAVDPAFAAMRNSRGFQALKKRMGLDR